MSRVAALIVTRNSAAWIGELLASVRSQTRPLDEIVVVDDGSTDGTTRLLREQGLTPLAARTTSRDPVTRIAANFVQGVRACSCDLVALGDHDDVWHRDRVEHQAGLLEVRPDAAMVASDGDVVGSDGVPTGNSLRGAFPVPDAWPQWSDAERMRFALRHSIATGSASMIRPAAFPALDVPPGWLHDRWWSLAATARAAMIVDREPVIDYRLAAGQQVGLDLAAQEHGGLRRTLSLMRQAPRSLRKQAALRRSLRPLALDPQVAHVIGARSVIGGRTD